jgi:hypothetical protein
MSRPPDVVLLAADWQARALIRAQLIEEAFEVVGTDTWAMMRPHLRPGMKPRLVIVDLKGLPEPAGVLNDLRVLMKPERVLVLMAVGTMSMASVRRLGFHAVSRPITIEEVVRAAGDALRSADAAENAAHSSRR